MGNAGGWRSTQGTCLHLPCQLVIAIASPPGYACPVHTLGTRHGCLQRGNCWPAGVPAKTSPRPPAPHGPQQPMPSPDSAAPKGGYPHNAMTCCCSLRIAQARLCCRRATQATAPQPMTPSCALQLKGKQMPLVLRNAPAPTARLLRGRARLNRSPHPYARCVVCPACFFFTRATCYAVCEF